MANKMTLGFLILISLHAFAQDRDCQTIKFTFQGKSQNEIRDDKHRERIRIAKADLYVKYYTERQSVMPAGKNLFMDVHIIKASEGFEPSVENDFLVEEVKLENNSEVFGEKTFNRPFKSAMRWMCRVADIPSMYQPRDEPLDGDYSFYQERKHSNGTIDSVKGSFQMFEHQEYEIDFCSMELQMDYTLQETIKGDGSDKSNQIRSSVFQYNMTPQSIETLNRCIDDIKEDIKKQKK